VSDPTTIQEICCCFGQPVAGNPTQYMMERAFAHHGLDWRYLTLEVSPEDLGDAVRGLRAMGFRGGNITKPHKVAVIEHLDRLSDAARLMGAVNCITREGRELAGENTDGKGFVESLRTVADPAGKRVVLLGAGGAARAIGVELGLAGATDIAVVNRTRERGEELARLLEQQVQIAARYVPWEGDCEVPEGTATSTLREGLVVADVVFNPPETRLLEAARRRGCTVLDGLGMLVNQAVIGFRIWTGITPDSTVMRDAMEEFLGI
jgi:shikimate dehydrogenase